MDKNLVFFQPNNGFQGHNRPPKKGRSTQQANQRHQSNVNQNTRYRYKSANMHYIYQQEYFQGLREDDRGQDFFIDSIDEKNAALEHFSFDLSQSPLKELEDAGCDLETFVLKTTYPGLMMGTGNPHEVKGTGIIKIGFSFDYVTGLPFLNGPSLKGILRSVFPSQTSEKKEASMKRTYLSSLFGVSEEEVDELEGGLFDGGDVFIGAYPAAQEGKRTLLALDFITPHDSSGFKNPIPINTLKIKPGITFQFAFILRETRLENCTVVSSADKLAAFKAILQDIGIGAKTNIGYGQMIE